MGGGNREKLSCTTPQNQMYRPFAADWKEVFWKFLWTTYENLCSQEKNELILHKRGKTIE